MRESTIEQSVCAYAKTKGCLSLKLAGQNQKGQPDRMFLYQGRVLFVEFKAPGKRPTALQARWLNRLTDHAFHATTCDDIEAGKRMINLITMSNTNQITTVANLSPFADKLLKALQRLTSECEAHPCGGFTTDDMQCQMGLAFTSEETLWAALDELTDARLIRYCGDDDEDAIGTCYEILPNV